jgi:hypothetical protein
VEQMDEVTPKPPTAPRDDLRLGSRWFSLRLEVGVDGRHGVRQSLHAEIVGVRVAIPHYGRRPHAYLDVKRLDGPLAGTVTEWKVDDFVELWTRDGARS